VTASYAGNGSEKAVAGFIPRAAHDMVTNAELLFG
jgi:hypothetical protein